MLPGLVFPAPPGLHGIDTNTVLDDRHCRAAKARGFSFCLRYVSRGEREQANDLHEAEARIILNVGLALMPVQHVARAGWSPTKKLGNHLMGGTRPRMSVKLGFHQESTFGSILRG